MEDLAKAQTTLLAQIDKRSVISSEWSKAIETQLASPALAKLDNRLEIEKLLHQADAKVNSLRAMVWRLGATGDKSRSPRSPRPRPRSRPISTCCAARPTTAIADGDQRAGPIVKRFLAANDEVVKSEELKADIVENRTIKVVADAADLMEATVENAQKNSANSKARSWPRRRRLTGIDLDHDRHRHLFPDRFDGVFLPRHRPSDDASERRAGRDGRRQPRCRDSRRRPRRRDRRPRQDGRRHPGECRAEGARRSRGQDQAGSDRRTTAQGRDGQARRHL